MCLFIPDIKLNLTQHLVIYEEATAEIVYSILGMWQKLICKEVDLKTSLAEQLAEQRIITPVTFFSNGIGRHKMLEHKTREIPRCHDIGILHQSSALFHLHLSWGILLFIPIELRMVFIEALTNNQNDIRRLRLL